MTLSGAMDIPKPNGDGFGDASFPVGESPCDVPNSYAVYGPDAAQVAFSVSPTDVHSFGTTEAEAIEEARRMADQLVLLPGEEHVEKQAFAGCTVLLTNFRVCIISTDAPGCAVIPLVSLDTVDAKDTLQLVITCKEGKIFRLTARSSESAMEWYKRLTQCTVRGKSTDCFAYAFATGVKTARDQQRQSTSWLPQGSLHEEEIDANSEFQRLEFDPKYFRVSNANKDFEVCETYPTTMIVPKEVSDADLAKCRDFRFLGRFPAVVWQCKQTRAVLLRSSQPRLFTSLFSWRCAEDEKILEHVRLSMDKGVPDGPAQITILDARSYTAAWANRAKNGGFESAEYYKNTEVSFLGLPNIHHVRYSFHQLRTLLTAPADPANYLQQLQATNWYLYLSSLLGSANRCVDLMMKEGRSVLVHCSDGWDRTTQIVSFTKLIADPYYRTLKGFAQLIQWEWVCFGHKFADRNGIAGIDANERAPIFLQFLDGVHQMLRQHPTAFEFNMNYLVKLAQHTYSGLFGTFLHNSINDAAKASLNEHDRTISIWKFLHRDHDEVVNQLYDATVAPGRLPLAVGVQDTHLWKEVYCCNNVERVINTPEERPTMTCIVAKEMERSLIRSNSTDSLNSMHKDKVVIDGVGTPLALHGSNTRLSEQSTVDVFETLQPTESFSSSGMTSSVRTVTALRPRAGSETLALKDLLDCDGLVRFNDPAQARMRQMRKDHQAKLDGIRGELAKVRQRSKSERTEASSLGGKMSLRSFNGDDLLESEDSIDIDRLSMIDGDDVGSSFRPTQGWEVMANACAVCHTTFGPFIREHHCRACMKAVCDGCSQHRFHQPVGSRSEQSRACKQCYQNMVNPSLLDTSTAEEDETPSPSSAHQPSPSASSAHLDSASILTPPINVPRSASVEPLPSAATHRDSTGSLTSQNSFHTGQAVQG